MARMCPQAPQLSRALPPLGAFPVTCSGDEQSGPALWDPAFPLRFDNDICLNTVLDQTPFKKKSGFMHNSLHQSALVKSLGLGKHGLSICVVIFKVYVTLDVWRSLFESHFSFPDFTSGTKSQGIPSRVFRKSGGLGEVSKCGSPFSVSGFSS